MNLVLGFDFDEAGEKAKVRAMKLIEEYNYFCAHHLPFLNLHPNPNATEQEQADYDLNIFSIAWDWWHGNLELPWIKPVVGTMPKNEVEWLSVFPQAKSRWGGFIGKRLKISAKYLALEEEAEKKRTIQNMRTYPENAEFFKLIGRDNLEIIRKQTEVIESRSRFLKSIGRKKKPGDKRIEITPDMVARAKAYPLERLVEINRQKFTKCFAHSDKKPSAYCKKNFIHCFVCQKSWDTIAVLMERDGMKYVDAVLHLQ